MVVRAPDRTLTAADATAVRDAAVAVAAERVGACCADSGPPAAASDACRQFGALPIEQHQPVQVQLAG